MDSKRPLNVSCGNRHQDISSRSPSPEGCKVETLLEEKVLYRTLKGSNQRYLFETPKGFYTEPFKNKNQEKGSIWNLLGSFIIICFVLSGLNISY